MIERGVVDLVIRGHEAAITLVSKVGEPVPASPNIRCQGESTTPQYRCDYNSGDVVRLGLNSLKVTRGMIVIMVRSSYLPKNDINFSYNIITIHINNNTTNINYSIISVNIN